MGYAAITMGARNPKNGGLSHENENPHHRRQFREILLHETPARVPIESSRRVKRCVERSRSLANDSGC